MVAKGWVTESRLQRFPSQQEPWRSMLVQGLVVPMMVQEGRWQVLMYTGTEKLPGGGVGQGAGPLTDSHLAIALEADALVLVTLDSSGLFRAAVRRVDPHAGIALDAAERRRIGRWQESVDAHSDWSWAAREFLTLLSLYMVFTKHTQRPTDLLLNHLAVANFIVLFSRGIPQTLAAFGLKYSLGEVECEEFYIAIAMVPDTEWDPQTHPEQDTPICSTARLLQSVSHTQNAFLSFRREPLNLPLTTPKTTEPRGSPKSGTTPPSRNQSSEWASAKAP
ncbi:hypothetical protein HPG69_009201 [Diceros bicornis minor]|uniref:Vomeronasal type-1 receptor n=1 Tax=Diceros bicornis minor TaxID=77932 RepID=A0A7J7F0I7_DICBM|nr:hypothetical protein HPG69_009201 [Diceros bicornis minor]